MTAYLLTIGDEILIGQITDTNSAWISRELNRQGIRVRGKSSVGDARQDIIDGVRHAASCADLVIMTGGLGPTNDDITKKTLAELFDCGMVFHQEIVDRIQSYFTRIGRNMPESVREQAYLPEKAVVLPNKVGTASGMWFDYEGKVYISLPGVPFEMEYLMSHEVLPKLKVLSPGRPIVHRTILTACEGESAIAKRLETFENNLPGNVKLAYLPALGEVRLRLSALGDGPNTPESLAELELQVEALKAELVGLIPELVFGYEEESLAEVVGQILMSRKKLFGTAESCTGGYIAHLITEIPGSSDYFQGSVVCYANTVKMNVLHVSPETLYRHGAVSENTVREMAYGALDVLEVDVALAVSGIAGPGGGTPEKPVGTVWVAAADRNRCMAEKYVFGRDRLKNIRLTGVYALNFVRKFLS